MNLCKNCELPIRYLGDVWTHGSSRYANEWQGRRCMGGLTGAEPSDAALRVRHIEEIIRSGDQGRLDDLLLSDPLVHALVTIGRQIEIEHRYANDTEDR